MARPQPAHYAFVAVQAFGSNFLLERAPTTSNYLCIRALAQPALFVGAVAQACLLTQGKAAVFTTAITTQIAVKTALVATLLAFGGTSACGLAWTTITAQAFGTGILLWQLRTVGVVRFQAFRELKSAQLREQSALVLKTLDPLVHVYLFRFICHFLLQVWHCLIVATSCCYPTSLACCQKAGRCRQAFCTL
jgi:Na+-driven multidrug efflux pump